MHVGVNKCRATHRVLYIKIGTIHGYHKAGSMHTTKEAYLLLRTEIEYKDNECALDT
jgi:hypothetical protein